ncbi:MAG TPA: TetR/AcrR family transcriptional regulator C-terminal domain-containing protein [Mycobacteriales bacterium]|nr:TetR/AcrR family transcriptional regulator C-terminal domain-containing protein [Mycobacteriales bacterium]
MRAFTAGFVQNELAEQEARRRTGMSEEEWRDTMAPYILQVLSSGKFPLLARYIRDAEDYPDMDKEFQIGLDLVLDGVAAAMP